MKNISQKIVLWVSLTFLIITISSCAIHTNDTIAETFSLDFSHLYNLQIYKNKVARFSGILAVQGHKTSLSYTLLDPTGITLLSATIPKDTEPTTEYMMPKLADSPLPSLLNSSLYRIFFQKTSQMECKKGIFSFFTVSTTEQQLRRSCWLGPLPYWTVEEPDLSISEGALYSQPWLGVKIKLVRISNAGS